MWVAIYAAGLLFIPAEIKCQECSLAQTVSRKRPRPPMLNSCRDKRASYFTYESGQNYLKCCCMTIKSENVYLSVPPFT